MTPILVPAINKKFSDTFSSDANTMAKKARQEYGAFIKAACATEAVPEAVLIGFMLIENMQLKPEAVSYGCSAAKAAKFLCSYGLMQMQVATAFQTIKDQAPHLVPAEASIVQKYLPGFLKPAGVVGFLINWTDQIHAALLKPEFAIWIGAMHLSQLMTRNIKKFGEIRLDHVIIVYNRGIGNYNKEVIKAGLSGADTAQLAAQLPVQETRDYLVKFLGVDGSIMAALRNP